MAGNNHNHNNSLKNVLNGVQNQASRWFHHITKAADDYKNRQESHRRTEGLQNNLQPNTNNIPPSLSLDVHDDKGKDSSTGDLAVDENEKDLLAPSISTPSVSKEPSPAPESSSSEIAQSSDKIGDGKLSVGASTRVNRSPSTGRRNEGEFIQIIQSSPLIDPSEVVVNTRDVHFAKIVLSPYEELKRADILVQKALEEKLRIASKLFNIPSSNRDETHLNDRKDAKELLVTCINNVDRLIGIVSSQKSTKDSAESQQEQQIIHSNLNRMLTRILTEFERKEEDIELRRQELHRVREQNHGYQERLRNLQSVISPEHSRPSSFHQTHDGPDVLKMSHPSKLLSSDPVVTFNSEVVTSSTLNHALQTSELAKNFADPKIEQGFEGDSEESEKNRDCPETEVVFVTKAEHLPDESASSLLAVESSSAVPELAKKGEPSSLLKTNGHNGENISDSEQLDEFKNSKQSKNISPVVTASNSLAEEACSSSQT